MGEKHTLPKGEMVLRTLAMPADTNANGDIFGGWLMSQMDMGGAILAKEIAEGRVVTVRVDGMSFMKPVAVGDVVSCHASCLRTGNSSMTINVEVWIKKCRLSRLDKLTLRRKRCLFMWRSTMRVIPVLCQPVAPTSNPANEKQVRLFQPDLTLYSRLAPPLILNTIFMVRPCPGFPFS